MTTMQDLLSAPEYLTYDDVLLLPNYSEVMPSEVDICAYLTKSTTLKLPVIAAPMDTVTEKRMAEEMARLGAYGIIHRNFSIEDQADQVREVASQGLMVGGSVGVGSDFEERVATLIKAGVHDMCVDSAHGHSKNVIEAVKFIRAKYPEIEILAGNVATYEGTKALFEAGADTVKVGMGPGSICTTRVISGMGVPQLTAVVECARAKREFKHKYIVADGGIKTSGDIVKALAAGADTVMLGSLLAGTDEAPGDVIQIEGKLFKSYRGMGSVAAMKKGSATRYGQKWEPGKTQKLVPEGVEGLVPHKGKLEDHIYQLMGGIKSGLGYLGAANLVELKSKARFIRISPAGLSESSPHSIVTK